MAVPQAGITDRQRRRQLTRYREDDPFGMTRSRRGKFSNNQVLYLIEDSELSRLAIGKYIDVWHYPDGHKEPPLNGVSLPYSTCDKLSEIEVPHEARK